MNALPSFSFRNSIATQLLKVVFAWYLVVAVLVTLVHMILEYASAKQRVFQQLALFQKNHEQGLAGSIWQFDDKQLLAILKGIQANPVVVGMVVENQKGEVIGAFGVIRNAQGAAVVMEPQINFYPIGKSFPKTVPSSTGPLTQLMDHAFALKFFDEDTKKDAHVRFVVERYFKHLKSLG